MLYLGSKRRIAKYLLPIIRQYRVTGQLYVEPFVGGGNLLEFVENPRNGYDINQYVIAFLREIRDNPKSFPKNSTEFTEKDYIYLKQNYKRLPHTDHAIIGFAGFPLSFGGKWFGGWCRRKKPPYYDYVQGAYNSLQRQSKKLQGAAFNCCSYVNLSLPSWRPTLIYCDPPYKGATNYGAAFDHDNFFEWCRDQAFKGHTVLVSEYNAPKDFECIWEHEYFVNIASTRTLADSRVERLFLVK